MNDYSEEQWNNKQYGGASKSHKKWTTLEHNGPIFPDEYIPHGVPVLYQGQPVYLEPLQEEYATMYARYLETEYVKFKSFNKNFFEDWILTLGDDGIIQSLEDCDFNLIYNHIIEQKEIKKERGKEEKEEDKRQKDEYEEEFKYALIDNKKEKIMNPKLEPPSIFIGRAPKNACNPNAGRVKKRLTADDIIINIGEDAPIPEPPSGQQWFDVIHDHTVEWLVSWIDNITNKTKYIWLSAHSEIRAKSDEEKFDRARKLKRNIKKIRQDNDANLYSDDIITRQIATALYFIDNLALRVGNEKGSDADTVGVVSLRVEHISLSGNNTIVLDFLGKDAVRYYNKITVDPQVYRNLEDFMMDKDKYTDLFDRIKAQDLNDYLRSFMKGLTAKVFRTYNASNLFQKELFKIDRKYITSETPSETPIDTTNIILDEFNKANAKVALLCNHQKNISKSFTTKVDRINKMINRVRTRIRKAKGQEKQKKLREQLRKLKVRKEMTVQLKNLSLGTSKTNYIDPRITVAFLKRHNLPIEKIFSKALQEKFGWAMNADEDFKF